MINRTSENSFISDNDEVILPLTRHYRHFSEVVSPALLKRDLPSRIKKFPYKVFGHNHRKIDAKQIQPLLEETKLSLELRNDDLILDTMKQLKSDCTKILQNELAENNPLLKVKKLSQINSSRERKPIVISPPQVTINLNNEFYIGPSYQHKPSIYKAKNNEIFPGLFNKQKKERLNRNEINKVPLNQIGEVETKGNVNTNRDKLPSNKQKKDLAYRLKNTIKSNLVIRMKEDVMKKSKMGNVSAASSRVILKNTIRITTPSNKELPQKHFIFELTRQQATSKDPLNLTFGIPK